ncbi:MAG: tRNA lysidine(34) synthetase [Microthrixaceae bacterium]
MSETADRPSGDPARSPLVAALLPRCHFPPAGSTLRCGWSGGPDSTALVVLALAAGCRVDAVHVEHGLRPGNDDGERLEVMAARLGVAVRSEVVEVGSGPNLEERARNVRRAVLGADAATGHTADDRAEGVLLALLRGAGPWGLAGMRRGPTKPLLDLRRADTVELCDAFQLATVEDPTNASPVHLRNRIRAEALPLLADLGRRDPVPQLVRLADHQRDLADLLDARASAVDASDGVALSALPRPVAVAALRRWWREETGEHHPPDHRAIERILEVADPQGPPRADVGAGWRVARTASRLRLERIVGPPPQGAQ